MDAIAKLFECAGFEWDKSNVDKNRVKHNVTPQECEQIFFNHPLVVADDIKHSGAENRYYALGQTDAEIMLFIVFTIRGKQMRIICARNMNRKERRVYKQS
ncbi:MAG: BrnT family toxin [Candidatus Omnitrophica bacterium]|nr:BrnT family toxin [Candidatus Omnitrophota bacterium]